MLQPITGGFSMRTWRQVTFVLQGGRHCFVRYQIVDSRAAVTTSVSRAETEERCFRPELLSGFLPNFRKQPVIDAQPDGAGFAPHG